MSTAMTVFIVVLCAVYLALGLWGPRWLRLDDHRRGE